MGREHRALIIGGHGQVGLLVAPKLAATGFAVTSLIRSPDQSKDIDSLGATPLIRDVTQIGSAEWDELLRGFDVVIWTAGNGGRHGPAATYAVDRDAALSTVDSLERLSAAGTAPRYIMVSYLGSTHHTVPATDTFYPYADAKKTVDDRLLTTTLDYVILAPARLTSKPAGGVAVIENDRDSASDLSTSRELVADVICEMSRRTKLPERRIIPFVDGDDPVAGI